MHAVSGGLMKKLSGIKKNRYEKIDAGFWISMPGGADQK